ncbi:MAG: leucyl aminopeptidase [Acidimicrobiales bacterium]|nr:leucyl aminopeptidase [Acidimicrobiales bacterium]
MSLDITLARSIPARSQLHAVGVYSDDVADEPGGLDWRLLRARGFEGKLGQIELLSGEGRTVAAVGLGARDEVASDALRRAGVTIARAASRVGAISVGLLPEVPESVDTVAAAQALAEGLVLGAYGYHELKSDPSPSKLRSVAVVGTGGAKVKDALLLGVRIGEAVCFTRDLVNEPGGTLTPVKAARVATQMAKREGLTIKVWDDAAIKKAKLGGLLGVNRGSTQAPRLVQLTYTPAGRASGHVALVGKGLTFDSGGLSIKTGPGMMTMKCDMAGAGAVLGAMSAISAVSPRVKVTAWCPFTDNMLGGDATRPGDVLTIRNGKTVEVLNTDAEGRLVLADALSLASEQKPDAIIDLATLTGACMVALGPSIAGLMGNDDGWVNQVDAAAGRTGERVWHLPLPKDYAKQLESPVADLKNIGAPHGGALTAGLFLSNFVADGIPWVHLDIAGPAFNENGTDEAPKGGTGFAVRLLLDLVANFDRHQLGTVPS